MSIPAVRCPNHGYGWEPGQVREMCEICTKALASEEFKRWQADLAVEMNVSGLPKAIADNYAQDGSWLSFYLKDYTPGEAVEEDWANG